MVGVPGQPGFRRLIGLELADKAFQSIPERQALQRVLQGLVRIAADVLFVDRVLVESKAKYLSTDQLRERLELLVSCWEELREKISQQIIPYPELKAMLLEADCPVTPEAINLSRERVRETYILAQMIRNRYTILDLAYELGWLESCVDEICSSQTYLR